MSDFEAAIEAQARGVVVRCIDLMEFNFRSGVQRWHQGETPIRTTDGKLWLPTRGIGGIGGIEQAYDGDAPEVTFEVSGTSGKFKEIAQKAAGSKSEYYDRLVKVYWQFLDPSFQPLDPPFAILTAKMRSITSSRKAVKGGVSSVLTLSAEHPTSNRTGAAYAMLTPQDQDARHPSAERDEILDRSPGNTQKPVQWPKF